MYHDTLLFYTQVAMGGLGIPRLVKAVPQARHDGLKGWLLQLTPLSESWQQLSMSQERLESRKVSALNPKTHIGSGKPMYGLNRGHMGLDFRLGP